jgi:hypothetical protein
MDHDDHDGRDVQDSECGVEMEDFKPDSKGSILFFRDAAIKRLAYLEDIQLGDTSHLDSFLDSASRALPGTIPYMKKAEWRKGEEALKAYTPLWKILKYGNDKPFQDINKFLRDTKSAIDRFAKEAKEKVPTHVTMCGSNFSIAENEESTFLERYAALVTSGCRCYFVERPTEVYRYFCDFDFKQLAMIPDKTIEAAAMVVQSVVRLFYPLLKDDEDALKAVVCTTDAKRVPAKGTTPELIKTGMHILWPGLLVSVDTALNIRESMLVEMQKIFGLRVEPSNSWEDVIDVSVYPDLNKKGSGLRMLGSCKSVTCSSCKGTKKLDPKDRNGADCAKCKGVGKLDEGRPYFPLMVLTTSGKRDVKSELYYLENMHALIVDTKIRTHAGTQPTPGYVLPEGAPVYLASEPGRIRRPGGTDVVDRGHNRLKTIGTLPVGQKVEVSRSDPVWPCIELMISKHPCGMYSQIIVNQITTNAKRTKYTAHINGPYSHYCQNKGSVHSSNRVFFEFDSTGFVQKCFGNKQGIHGPCGPSYRSSTEPLSPSDLEILFPDAKNTYLKALDACRDPVLDGGSQKEKERESEEEDQETAFLGRKMRTLLLAGDYLSNFLFGSNFQASGKDDGEPCLWSRTLRNEGRYFVNVGSFSADKMDTYVEIDSAALGTRKNAARLLGFLDEKDELEDEGDYDKTEFRNESENENRKSLLSLHKKMFGALDDMINDCVELDQSSLKKNGRRLGLNGHGNGNDFAFDEDADLKKGIRLREYDAETLLQL